MVYGLNVKPEHGYYVEVEALDGELSEVVVADQTPDGGLPLNRNYAFTSGRAVIPDHMPTRMQWGDPHGRSIPDFDNGLVLNVSERAKTLIEQFETGVHQFLPVDYFDRPGNLIERRYFLIVGNRLDSLDRERTTMVLFRGMMWRPASDLEPEDIPPDKDRSAPPKIVFNAGQIGGAHLWFDKHLAAGPYISNALAEAIKVAGLTGLRLSESGLETV